MSGGVDMFCWRCGEPIREGEPYGDAVTMVASGPGSLVHIHEVCPVEPRRSASVLRLPRDRH